jgi:cation transport ATPase
MSMQATPKPAPKPTPIRLALWHKTLTWALLLALVVSGTAWLVLHLLTPEAASPHLAQTWSLRVHGGLAMLMLLITGSLLPRHVAPAWARGRNRTSGAAVLGTLALLTATGWSLYYSGGPSVRDVASLLHWITGLTAPVLLLVHVALGRRRARDL